MIAVRECLRCDGRGWVLNCRVLDSTEMQTFQESCSDCKGTGTIFVDLNEEIEE